MVRCGEKSLNWIMWARDSSLRGLFSVSFTQKCLNGGFAESLRNNYMFSLSTYIGTEI